MAYQFLAPCVSCFIFKGKVFFPRTGAEVLIGQLVNFGVEKYDDLADAFTLLMAKVIESDRPSSRRKPGEVSATEPDPHPGLTWSLQHMNDLGFDFEPITLDTKF